MEKLVTKNNWCNKFITEDEIKQVSEAVHRAEQKTCGEIVPMIVHRSSVIGHVPLQLFTFWIVFLLVLYVGGEPLWHNWLSAQYYALMGVVLTPFIMLLARVPALQRILTSDTDEVFQVFSRARVEFNDLRLQHTQARTGILIFLSVLERRCVVLADQGIANKLPAETWQAVVDKVVTGVKTGKVGEGLIAAVDECGRLLAQHFPLRDGDKNELSNDLVMKE